MGWDATVQRLAKTVINCQIEKTKCNKSLYIMLIVKFNMQKYQRSFWKRYTTKWFIIWSRLNHTCVNGICQCILCFSLDALTCECSPFALNNWRGKAIDGCVVAGILAPQSGQDAGVIVTCFTWEGSGHSFHISRFSNAKKQNLVNQIPCYSGSFHWQYWCYSVGYFFKPYTDWGYYSLF